MATKLRQVLAVETSCDETAAAIVSCDADGVGKIKSNVVFSQIDVHQEFGGVVPELAARAHVEKLDLLIKQALEEADCALDEMDAFAATSGPGLIGGLMVGLMSAKALAMVTRKPLYAINHLEGHALTARLTDQVDFPFLMLLVSGGHTQLILVKAVGQYERWGTTIDDALGEAFDKTAKLLGLDYPGGPAVERAASLGDPDQFAFPIPMRGADHLDFSFSGLKTAVRQKATDLQPLSDGAVHNICAGFQTAVIATLKDRLKRALTRFSERADLPNQPALVVAGGVAANRAIRALLDELCVDYQIQFIAPPHHLCTDNAAMIGWAALERMNLGLPSDPLNVAPRARWPLDADACAKIGSGKRGTKA